MVDRSDPWRWRMWRTAERLRVLDENLFQRQIAFIEECLHRDATWNLEYALTSSERWRAYSSEGAAIETS